MVRPACRRNINTCRLCHIIAGLQVVNDQDFFLLKVEFLHQVEDCGRRWLSHLTGNIPAVHVVGHGKIVCLVVTDNVLADGVRVNHDDTALCLKAGDNLLHAGVGMGNMVFHIVAPELLLLGKLGFQCNCI